MTKAQRLAKKRRKRFWAWVDKVGRRAVDRVPGGRHKFLVGMNSRHVMSRIHTIDLPAERHAFAPGDFQHIAMRYGMSPVVRYPSALLYYGDLS